jgi:hypothetical protein
VILLGLLLIEAQKLQERQVQGYPAAEAQKRQLTPQHQTPRVIGALGHPVVEVQEL